MQVLSLQLPAIGMPTLQVSVQYCSQKRLGDFLRKKFPDIKSFKIKEIDGLDAVFTFVTPRPLGDVRLLFKHEVPNWLIANSFQEEWKYVFQPNLTLLQRSKADPAPLNSELKESTAA